ncbi:MAG TPA: hypothetical protein VLB29_12230 [Nocardioidaceae bacterium]|nr:hypothetical protein [Nocardioidaceae bacterium]
MSENEPDDAISGLFEDLEQQAAGIHLAERDAELLDRARGEYATVSFASRIHASLGHEVVLTLLDGDTVRGVVGAAGLDWCAIDVPGQRWRWLVRLQAVSTVQGLSTRAVPQAARPAIARLSFGSALHRLAEEVSEVALHLTTGREPRVRVVRIGADFVEVEAAGVEGGPRAAVLVPFGAILAARA